MTLLKLLQNSSTRWKQNRICRIIFYSNHVSWQRFFSGSWHTMTQFRLCSLVSRWPTDPAAIYHMFWSHITILWHDKKNRLPVSSVKSQRVTQQFHQQVPWFTMQFQAFCSRMDTATSPGFIGWCHSTSVLGKLTKYLGSANSSIMKPVLKSLRFL